jgi:hypothetical protein|tara:strand:- start:377 stop:949 length:573 start_codon:yes stop_codon:yes gene_type:complete
MVTSQAAGEIGELYVFQELLRLGVSVYVPLVDEGVDALARTPGGQTMELQIKSAGGAGGKHPRWFQMSRFDPRKEFFIIAVETLDGKPGDVWVFPSAVFDAYASRPPKGAPRDLDLDGGSRKYGMALKDLLCGFRNCWDLLVHFERYEALLESPEVLEDILTMREAIEAPEQESLSLEEYERHRSAGLSH